MGLRIAILGGGMVAQVHRRAAILAGAQIDGVLDHNYTASVRLANDWGVGQAYTDIGQVVASGVDVVHVCTPNSTHLTYAKAALEAGLNVICEKPLGLTVAEAQELAHLAAQQPVVAAVPFVYRYHPLVHEIRSRRLSGQLGELRLIHGSYLQDWLASPGSSNWRVDPETGGVSRAFADIGSHWCDLVEWVSGERISTVCADLAVAVPERPAQAGPTFSADLPTDAPSQAVTTEDLATVVFRTATGVPGSLVVSQVSPGRLNRLWFELDAANFSAVFNQENPETIWLGQLHGAQVIARDPSCGSAGQRRLSVLPAGHPQGWGDCFNAFVADVYAAVQGATPEGLPTFEDGLRAAVITEAVLTSARERSWAQLAAPAPGELAGTALSSQPSAGFEPAAASASQGQGATL